VATPSEELGAIVSRLEDAAQRLKAEADLAPDGEPRREPPAPASPRRLGDVLDGLERANLEVRRARARLAELEARLDFPGAA
jgi:hypothetical protein